MEEKLGAELRSDHRLARFLTLQAVSAAFTPHGGFGLYVAAGAASFQNIRVEPLGAGQ